MPAERQSQWADGHSGFIYLLILTSMSSYRLGYSWLYLLAAFL